MGEEEKMVDVAQAAKILGVSEKTVRRMLDDPECPLKGEKIYKACLRIPKSLVLTVRGRGTRSII